MDDGEHAVVEGILAGLDLDLASAQISTQVLTLCLDFPAWAIWQPVQGVWTAIRPAYSGPPGPDQPMIWARATSDGQLADRMRAADQQFEA